MTNKPIISMEKVFKKYENNALALNDINVEIHKGEFVFIVGPSGAGKSTFMKRQDIPYLRRSLGIVFQDYRLLPDKTVYENIAFAMRVIEAPRRLIQHSVNSVLDVVGLKDKYNCFPHQLSGGERRRTEIARCLAIDPKFIMLDEPFAGVDPIAVQDIQSIVAKLKHKNIGILITDHNVYETLSICDRAYLLFEGKVLFQGTAEQLAENEIVREKYLGKDFVLRKKDF